MYVCVCVCVCVCVKSSVVSCIIHCGYNESFSVIPELSQTVCDSWNV